MTPARHLAVPTLCVWLAAACITGAEGTHPLSGRIWDVDAQQFIAEGELIQLLAARRYVLLGEVHDNPEHHRLQAQVLERLADAGRRPAVVLEMLPRNRGEALGAVLADPAVTAQDVRRSVAWDSSGWPDWDIYAPIFETALKEDLELAAGDLSDADREALRRRGAAGLDPAAAKALGLEAPLPTSVQAALEASIRAGHCDLLPEAALPAMVAFQRARDAQLARSLFEAADAAGAVLIAGAGHARRDVGVPYHLARFDPGAGVVSVGLVEVRPEHTDPRRALVERFEDSAPFDFVWFTRRAPREDPCEALQRQLLRTPSQRP